MILSNIRRILKTGHLTLLPILGLAYYTAFIPHRYYPYPIHVDEWVHLARSKAMMAAGSITFSEPFFGQASTGISSNLEAGFQFFWGTFQAISGISWMTIFRYFPGIIFMITVLTVYILARRKGFGWEAAFFTCLIPTTLGILGPSFLVPVSLGLLFIPLILFLAFYIRTIWSYLLIFILITFLLAMHPPSAIYPIIILAPYILLNIRDNFKHILGIGLALILPFLIIFSWIFSLVLQTARQLIEQQAITEYVELPRIIQTYGYLPILFALLGTFLLVLKGGRKNYGLVLGLLALLVMLVAFFTFHYGVSIVYERGLMYMMLMSGIIAGAGLAGVKNFRIPERLSTWLRLPFLNHRLVLQNTGRFLCLAVIALTLYLTIPQRTGTLYYQMIDRTDYQAFVWIKDNIGQNDNRAVLDPWKATAFTAITGQKVYTRIHMSPLAKDNKVYTFLQGGSSNTTFLKENGITIVYTRVYKRGQNVVYPNENPDLIEVAENIYLLK